MNQLPQVSTNSFTYFAAENTFVTDQSDVQDFRLGRIFNLVSTKTGRVVEFTEVHRERDDEGELLCITYRPTDPGLWAAGTVKIYND